MHEIKIVYVPIKKLSEAFSISENSLKAKVPEQFVLRIGSNVRYDLYGILNYFKHGSGRHNILVDDILNIR